MWTLRSLLRILGHVISEHQSPVHKVEAITKDVIHKTVVNDTISVKC